MKRPTSISEALRLARKRYADGGVTPASLARAWTPPEEALGPEASKFVQEYPEKFGKALSDVPEKIYDVVKYPGQILYGEKPYDPDEAVKWAVDASGMMQTGGIGGVAARTGETVLGSGPVRSVKDNRITQLKESAQRIKAGEGSAAEHAELVSQFKPVRSYDAPIAPATYDEMYAALSKDKLEQLGAPRNLPEGYPAAVRLDIPSYQNKNTWVVSVHDPKTDYSAGKVIGYDSVAHLNAPTFGVQPKGAVNIAAGKPKSTIATVQGGWKPTTPEEAYALAQKVHGDPAWAQVGMDPERHAYFYNRATMEPITSAEEALHIGPLVYAKNPVVGKVEDYPFARGGFARKHYATGGNPNYGDTVYEQLLKDIAAQKAKALPEVPELRRDTPQSITPGTKPAEVKHDLGGYEPVAEPVVRQPSTGAGGGGDGLSGSYGPGTSTPSGIMSSTSTAAAPPAGATPGVTGTPGFSFNGAPIGAVEAYDLPAPAPSAPLTTHAVTTTSVAPAPGQFGDMYTGQPAAQNNATQNNAAANQAALGAQVGAQVGAALNTIGTTPAATPPAAAPAPVGVSPSASQMAAAKSSLAAALQAQNAPPAMQPGVQQPLFVAPPAFTNPADLGPDVPSSMIGPAPGVDNVSNYSYGQLAAQNEAAQNAVDAVAAGLPSAPAEASTAPAAPAAAAPAAPAAPMGMSISEASPATMAAMAAAARGTSIASPEDEAQAEAEAQAQAEAAAANAAEANSSMSGMDDGGWGGTGDGSDGSDGSSMGGMGGEGEGGFGGEGGGTDGGGEGGGEGGGDGGGGDGGGGGGEKRGGLVKWKYHPVGRKSGGMVGKALAISDKRLYKMRDHKDWSEHKDFDETGGKLSQMSPDEFLKKSKPLNMDHDDKHIIHHFKKKLEHGHKLDPLALYSGGGQDGRHRAHAAKQLGINKIPVITWPSKAHGGSIVDRALVVTSKKANRQPGRR